jgi:glycosyltransferase involved in cell wall biosynthesis
MKVSIIIPCYNVADHIDDALTSALSQTYPDTEIICVDNGSTDSTCEFIKNYVDRGEVILLHEAKRGAPAARNKGWRNSTGEWVQFLDADDIILPEKIADQLILIEKNPEAPFIAAATIKTDLVSGFSRQWPVHSDAWKGLLENRLGITSANLFNRSALEKVDGWDVSLKSSQEYDLMFRMMQLDDAIILDTCPEGSIIQSRESGSISSADVKGNKNRYLSLMARITTYLREERPEIYDSLESSWFQDVFMRIHLNALEGMSDSIRFHDAIIPLGFIPQDHQFIPSWFKFLYIKLGYRWAERARKIKSIF